MPNFAKITLVGHLGKDAELKSTATGTPVLKFSIAVSTGYGEKKTPSWYECAFFGKPAESVSQFMTKGKAVLIDGEPSIRKWQSEGGKSGTSVDVKVSSVTLIGGGKDEHQPAKEPAQQPDLPEAAAESGNDIPF